MYKWLKDGVPVDDFTTSQFFRFQNIRPEDTGSYKCIAQNDAGTIFSEKIDVVVARKSSVTYITSTLFVGPVCCIN